MMCLEHAMFVKRDVITATVIVDSNNSVTS